MDDLTFRQLIKSDHLFPEVTDVIYDINQLTELIFNALNSTQKGFNSVWDKTLFKFHYKYLNHGFSLLERLIEERNLKIRLIVEATRDNIEPINSIKYYEIKHLDNVRGNFGILDERAYMIFIFLKDDDKPEQALFSNSKSLVYKQQLLFDRLWEIGTPLKTRNKELEYQQIPEIHKSLTTFEDVRNECISFMEHAQKELLIFSSINMLNYFKHDDYFWNQISVLLKRGIKLKILTDGYSSTFIRRMDKINSSNKDNQISIGYSTKLGNIKEFVPICDGKLLLEINFSSTQHFRVSILNERNHVLVQEILFEKCWNEIESLAGYAKSSQ